MKNFVYLVGAPGAPEVAALDPAWDVPAIERALEAEALQLTAIVLSHHHADHLNGVGELLRRHDVPVYAQRAGVRFAPDVFAPFGAAVREAMPGERLRVGSLELELLHTPGHTPGCQCVLARGALFTGDTLFVNACGRCDLPGGDVGQLFDSLHRVLGGLPAQTQVFPGHDYGDVRVSTLARERAHNPWLQLTDQAAFSARRLPRG